MLVISSIPLILIRTVIGMKGSFLKKSAKIWRTYYTITEKGWK